MAKERAYCDCSNFNNRDVCMLFDKLRHILNGTESLAEKENKANTFCSKCNVFKDMHSVYRRNS